MQKRQLRERYLSYLRNVPLEEKQFIEKNMYDRLWNSSYWKDAQMIGITWSQRFEWNTLPIIERALNEQKRVALPKVNKRKHEIEFFSITDITSVEKGFVSIMEPIAYPHLFVPKQDIHLLIVPGIVFTRKGYRIGFGGGYYDRYLVDFANETISLCSEKQIVNEIAHEAHDQRVNILITERSMIETNADETLS